MTKIEIQPNKCYILAGDISASMSTIDPQCGGNSRYNYMLEKFKMFIKTAEDFDQHMPTVMLFGEKVQTYPETTLEKVAQCLENPSFEGFTNTDRLIDEAYRIHKNEKVEYAEKKEFHPGTVLLIFTDGDPTNRVAVERSIIRIANEIDREDEFTITFLTVGTRSRELDKYLQDLHDSLEDKLTRDFDIVHVESLEDTDFFAAMQGAMKHQ